MINLMYVVFIGMLALNVSSEVLDGFELVEESVLRSVNASNQQNNRIYQDLVAYHKANPEKTGYWYDKSVNVKAKSDSLFNYIQALKVRIARQADGKKGDPENLKHADDLNAAYDVMFVEKGADGKADEVKLKTSIDAYRKYIGSLITNPDVKEMVENNLRTEPSSKAKAKHKSWTEAMFQSMPVAASITLLTKLQNDICDAEGAVLRELLRNIDVTDFRVNEITAFVIPEAQTVMRGTSYKANIVLAAIDTTQQPRIFVNGKQLPESANGQYVVGAGSTGTFQVKGYIEMASSDGSFQVRNFATDYFVVEPSATVAPTLMNMLYAGIANEIRISVPGVPSQNISASISNGTLTHKGNDLWVANVRYGSDAVISVRAKVGNVMQEMAKNTFRVRQLPDPSAYLTVTNADGNKVRFKGGPLPKSSLANADVLSAAIDDGILDIGFTVLRFEVQKFDGLGLAIKESSEGAGFSARQKDLIRSMNRGQTLLIRSISTRGPDGVTRTLNSPIEIIII
jgi:gliding motility-associated protein GldM